MDRAVSGFGLNLAERVQMKKRRLWPTPTAHNAKETNAPSEAMRNTPSLANQVDGALNPTWVEWLMGWPLFWTSLDDTIKPNYDSWHEAQQRTQASSKEIQSGIMRNVWWTIDPSETSQGRQSDQQSEGQCDDTLPALPHNNSLFDRELGKGASQASNVQDLRGSFPAKKNPESKTVRQNGMPKGKREAISRVAVGIKNRTDRLKAIGNGQVPGVVALAWQTLTKRIGE